MKERDFIQACKSGIQKAIRRGNLDLAKTCFDALWEDERYRNWLMWRSCVLVAEEAWYMAGELGKLRKSGTKEEKDWRRFIYQLTLVQKAKDAQALYKLALNDYESASQEIEAMLFWLKEAAEDPDTIIKEMADQCMASMSNLTEYETDAIEVFRWRASTGGMTEDKWICLAAMVLTASRGLHEEGIENLIEDGIKRWKKISKNRKPKTINIPWYVYDMHTDIGRFALNVFMKKYSKRLLIEDKKDLSKVWFYHESAFVPSDMTYVVEEKVSAGYAHTKWWPLWIEKELKRPHDVNDEWKRVWPKLEALVVWSREKRS